MILVFCDLDLENLIFVVNCVLCTADGSVWLIERYEATLNTIESTGSVATPDQPTDTLENTDTLICSTEQRKPDFAMLEPLQPVTADTTVSSDGYSTLTDNRNHELVADKPNSMDEDLEDYSIDTFEPESSVLTLTEPVSDRSSRLSAVDRDQPYSVTVSQSTADSCLSESTLDEKTINYLVDIYKQAEHTRKALRTKRRPKRKKKRNPVAALPESDSDYVPESDGEKIRADSSSDCIDDDDEHVSCPKCGNTFSSQFRLEVHLFRVHGAADSGSPQGSRERQQAVTQCRFSCRLCGKKLSSVMTTQAAR